MHGEQDALRDVLGRNPKLARHVVAAELFEVAQARLVVEQVEPEPGADRDLLHAGQVADGFEHRQFFFGREAQARAALGPGALAVRADVSGCHLRAGRAVHVCGRAADVGDVALEAVEPGNLRRLGEYRTPAAPLDNPALVRGERAEGAGAEAAAVRRYRKPDRLERRYLLFVVRVRPAGVGQVVEVVEFGLGQWFGRRVVHYPAVCVRLSNGPAGRIVGLATPEAECVVELALIGADRLVRG